MLIPGWDLLKFLSSATPYILLRPRSSMENVINTLLIQNFKSIRSAVLHPRRVNLIIGQPNVGKSTVLEAMSLLGGLPFEQKKKFMRSFIRYEKLAHLFHDSILTNPIRIETDNDLCLLGKKGNGQGKGYQYGVFSQAAYRLLRVQLGLPLLEGRAKSRGGEDARLLSRMQTQLPGLGPLPEPGYIYTELDNNGHMDRPDSGGRYLASAPAWTPRPVKAYRFKANTKLGNGTQTLRYARRTAATWCRSWSRTRACGRSLRPCLPSTTSACACDPMPAALR